MAETASEKRLTTQDTSRAAIEWDDAAALDAYANMSNVSFSREEMTLNFGLTRMQEPGRTGGMKLTHRIMMNPYAAKRLALVLSQAVKQYESRFGPVNVGGGQPSRPASSDGTSSAAPKDGKPQIVK